MKGTQHSWPAILIDGSPKGQTPTNQTLPILKMLKTHITACFSHKYISYHTFVENVLQKSQCLTYCSLWLYCAIYQDTFLTLFWWILVMWMVPYHGDPVIYFTPKLSQFTKGEKIRPKRQLRKYMESQYARFLSKMYIQCVAPVHGRRWLRLPLRHSMRLGATLLRPLLRPLRLPLP